MGQLLKAGNIVALIGDLGTGKTVFVKGVVRGLGGNDEDEVTSPTFVLVNQYQGRLPIYHMDLYRLSDLRELENLGWEEFAFSSGITLIEWAEKIVTLLPPEFLEVNFHWLDYAEREIIFNGRGRDYEELVNLLKKKWMEEKSKWL